MSDSEFTRTVEFQPAFDKRSKDPRHNYGIHGVTLRMVLKGPLGATQFVLYTNWQLPHVRAEFKTKIALPDRPHLFHEPQPADLGYHSPRPMYEGHEPMDGTCDVLGGQCYYDGSGLRAERVFNALCEEGHEGVWRILRETYDSRFGSEPTP